MVIQVEVYDTQFVFLVPHEFLFAVFCKMSTADICLENTEKRKALGKYKFYI